MSKNDLKGRRKALIRFLKTGKNQEGKNYFERWFIKLVTDKQLDHYQSEKDEVILKNRIKKSIDSKIKKHEFKTIDLNSGKRTKLNPRPVLIWAASVTVLIGIVSAFYFYAGPESNIQLQSSSIVYKSSKAAFGEKRKLILEDSTVVFLNSGSEFRYPENFSKNTREVYLSGEAFFKVSKDKNRPFIVNSGDVKTTVLGTSFNVQAFQDQSDVKITVVSGKVRVNLASDYQMNKGSILLTKNLEARYSKDKGQITRYETDASSAVLWKDNVLNFNNQSLTDIAVALERWFNVEIVIEDDKLHEYSYVGQHVNPTLYQILEALHFSTAIDYEIHDKKVILKNGEK